MSKVKRAFFCQNCGYESAKWIGKCPACEEWNTFVEELIEKEGSRSESEWKGINGREKQIKTLALGQIVTTDEKCIATKDAELDRVLGEVS